MLAEGGDASRGARRFFSRQATCGTCHTIDGFGGNVGPDLSHVGQSMDRPAIIRSIVRPSDYFAPEFQLHVLATQQGQVHSGIVLSTDSGRTTLQTAEGEKLVFPAAEIESLVPQPRSIMPDRLEATLSIDGLRDLVAFLSALQ